MGVEAGGAGRAPLSRGTPLLSLRPGGFPRSLEESIESERRSVTVELLSRRSKSPMRRRALYRAFWPGQVNDE